MYVEYVGMTQRVAALIEAERLDSSESKDDILWRILPRREVAAVLPAAPMFDLGQGVKLRVGEKLYLYLAKPNSVDKKPDGIAEIRSDGLHLDGHKINPSHGSVIAPAMHKIQER